MDAFDSSMFPDPIVIRKGGNATSAQGGANPTNAGGVAYLASVQPREARMAERPVGPEASVPVSVRDYDVFLPLAPGDTFARSVTLGDQVVLQAGDVLNVLAPGQADGGVLLRLKCQGVL